MAANEMTTPEEMKAVLDSIRQRHGKDVGMRKVMDALHRLGNGEGEDRGRGRDAGYRWEQRDRARDAARRFADDDEGDPEELIEALCENFPELGSLIRSAAEDARGLAHFGRDRRERRSARDYRGIGARKFGDGRRLSRDYGPVDVGRENRSPDIEEFRRDRAALREETQNLEDRRANDRALAFDAGASDQQVFAAMFPGAASIETRGR